MLKSYGAEISGSELIWIDKPPQNLKWQPVLVVIEDTPQPAAEVARYDFSALIGRLAWRGDAVAAERAQRDAW